MNLSEKVNQIMRIENINIFQNIFDSSHSSCVIIFRDKDYKPFLLYIEKLDKDVSISTITDEIRGGHVVLSTMKSFSLTTDICTLKDGSALRMIDLSFEPETKRMTKEQIEKQLGYKVEII